ncbi:outer membrane protein assembly factor BamC [Marinobacter sp. 2_MG-2023]|uniref:outer membrane protein assembly factor BamC n=1 Tax=Marinobacter sp. 2_MG-2023 TaxID=3062679 RepID=UPI0026E2568F|nr:outer membrane protein assembly factor BamC [Marinobacter sp. 2_MG-2023]MDO6442571.1 outer membrane protein assembly factor BamC [Marinobacter sp. 2_MG-2023]
MPVLSGTRKFFAFRPTVLASGLLLAVATAGCSFVDDRSERYVDAKEGDALTLPETADTSRFNEVMPIRRINPADASKMYTSDIPQPPDMTSEILEENYVVEELDGRAWLLVNDVPGRIWPAVTGYMNEQGLGVAYDNPQLGMLQSDVANFSMRARALLELSSAPTEATTAEPRAVLQVRIAPGVRRKTTEIQVRKLTSEEGGSWPAELISWRGATDPSTEELSLQKRVLADLGEFLKAREESKSFSRAASGMVSKPLVKLVSEDDRAKAISMDLDYGRAWAEVNRALTESDIAIVDLNRSEGWLFVDFRSADERDPGWFSWFSDKEKPRHTHTVTVDELDGLVQVTAETAESYTGVQGDEDLLTQLFNYLY